MSTRALVGVWAVLMTLLGLTIGATFLPLGPFKPLANIGIAFAKTLLVMWFYMHLRELPGVVRLTAAAALLTLLILLMLISTDYLTRFWFKEPDGGQPSFYSSMPDLKGRPSDD